MSPSGQGARAASRFSDPSLLSLAALLLAVFLLSRLPFFWYYPSVQAAQDTQGYLDMVAAIRGGHWPRFLYRTPGYPLLFWFVTLFTGRWIAVSDSVNPANADHTLFIQNGCYYGDLSAFQWRGGQSWVGHIRAVSVLPPDGAPDTFPGGGQRVVGQCHP